MIYVIIWCLLGLTSSLVAKNKGNDGCGGFILGFLLGPFGLFITLFAGSNEEEKNKRIGNTKKCFYCAEYVKEEAILCKHCGKDLVKSETATQDDIKPEQIQPNVPAVGDIFSTGYETEGDMGGLFVIGISLLLLFILLLVFIS